MLDRIQLVKRWYFVSLGLLLALLLLARYTILASAPDSPVALVSTANVVDNLVAALLTSLIIGLAYLYLYPERSMDSFSVIRSRDIATYISGKCRTANCWNVRSRAANYFTTVTLNDLVDAALHEGRSVSVRVQVIDPTDADLLHGYASAMQDTAKRVATWSAHRAKIEVYTSLLRAALVAHRAPRVNVSVGLSPHPWVMSLDYSDEFALVTCQRNGDDALAFARSSEFYLGWADDFDAGWKFCRVVEPRIAQGTKLSLRTFQESDYERIRGFYSSMALPEPDTQELGEIVKTLNRETDYE